MTGRPAEVLQRRNLRCGFGPVVQATVRRGNGLELHLEGHGRTPWEARERLNDLIVLVCSDPEKWR